LRLALGTGSLTTSGFNLDRCLETAEELGFEFLDLWIDRENLWPLGLKREQKEETIEKISQRGLKVVSTCPILFKTVDWKDFEYEFNLAHPDELERRKAVDFVKGCMELSRALQSTTMLVLPGKVDQPDFIKSKVPYRAYFAQAVKSLKECAEHASQFELTLGVENAVVGNLADTPGELHRLLSAVNSERVKAYVDTANANVFYPPEEYLEVLEGKLVNCVHVSDNDGTRPDHLPVGMGRIDFPRFLKKLKNSNWDGYLVLETFYAENPTAGLKMSKERLSKIMEDI
jgi:protein FrlC